MKLIFIIITMIFSVANAEDCSEISNEVLTDKVYEVDSKIPEHLRGATITVTRADGRTSTVPAEKFMVVPRKQTIVAGQDRVIEKKKVCDDKDQNLIIGEVRKDHTGLDTRTSNSALGSEATVNSKKELVPGISYFRRGLLGPAGLGVGVDTNGTLKGLIGVEF